MITLYKVVLLKFGSGGIEYAADSHNPQLADVNNGSTTMENMKNVDAGTY